MRLFFKNSLKKSWLHTDIPFIPVLLGWKDLDIVALPLRPFSGIKVKLLPVVWADNKVVLTPSLHEWSAGMRAFSGESHIPFLVKDQTKGLLGQTHRLNGIFHQISGRDFDPIHA